MPDTVNPQITDAVTQANAKVIGEAPAMAMATVYQSLAHSTGLLFENAVAAQQQMAITAQAATTQGVATLYSIDTASAGIATQKIFSGGGAAAASTAASPAKGG